MREEKIFEGTVLSINIDNEFSYVILKDIKSGETVQTDVKTKTLIKNNLLNKNDQFEIYIIIDKNGNSTPTIKPILHNEKFLGENI